MLDSFQDEGHGGDDVDDSDDVDDIGDGDDGDDYTPSKAYRRKDLETQQPKRKRGRPKKIRTAEELKLMKAKKENWRAGKIFKCPHCPRSFTRRQRVSIHIRLRHGFECATCTLK